MAVTPSGTVISAREVQPAKALFPMSVIPAGRVTPARLRQPSKRFAPMTVTPAGIVRPVRAVQSRKAPFPMVSRPSGSSTRVSRPLPLKAEAISSVTLSGTEYPLSVLPAG